MSGFYTPDITGTLYNYKVDVDIFAISSLVKRIDFEVPVFRDSIVMTDTNTGNELLLGTDWNVLDSDIDYTAQARMLSMDASFNKTLLKSITITRSTSVPLSINLSYQRLYPVSYRTTLNDSGVITEINPQMIIDAFAKIAIIENQLAPINNTIAPTDVIPKLLKEDPHKTNLDNYIENEEYIVNTYNHVNVIMPKYGSFFKGSTSIYLPDVDRWLVEDMDYVVRQVDLPRTRVTHNVPGVYQVIQLTTEYAGSVQVSYHAYGGTVTYDDMEAMRHSVLNVLQWANGRQILTPQTLPSTYPIIALDDRVTKLEDRMRALAITGNPLYTDGGHNVTKVYRLRATSVQYHWFTIASMYKVDGSDDAFTADRMKFRFRLVSAGMMGDVSVAFDATKPRMEDRFVVETDSVIHDLNYTLYGASSPHTPLAPQFRVIYNDTLGEFGGAYLQIKLSLEGLEDTLAIENLSGVNSTWMLMPAPTTGTYVTPSNDIIVLPDGMSTWDSSNPSSRKNVKMMPLKKPYLLWEGAITEVEVDDELTLTGMLPEGFRLEDVYEAILVLDDENGNSYNISTYPTSFVDNGLNKLRIITSINGLPMELIVTPTGSGQSISVNGTIMEDTHALRYILLKV